MVQKEDLPECLSVSSAPFDFFLKRTVRNQACHLCFEEVLYRLLYIFRLYRHGKQQVQIDQVPFVERQIKCTKKIKLNAKRNNAKFKCIQII